jgi:DNA-binding PadR family transcriptional regulator
MAVAELGADAYGLGIRREVSRRCEHDYSVGAIYTTMARLEDKGWVTSTVSAPLAVRGGRARRQFSITGDGRRALAAARRQAEQLWQPTIGEQLT